MNQQITQHDIVRVLQAAKKGKAYGYDGVPVDVLRNGNTPNISYRLFNYCFLNGMLPEFWKYGIINPIPKAWGKDNRIPLNYRGITLTSSVYKLFCSVLHNRIAEWKGVSIDDEKMSILLYADDIVWISETEEGLQEMLNLAHRWGQEWKLNVSTNKTKVVHFRNPSMPRSEFSFSCGSFSLETAK